MFRSVLTSDSETFSAVSALRFQVQSLEVENQFLRLKVIWLESQLAKRNLECPAITCEKLDKEKDNA